MFHQRLLSASQFNDKAEVGSPSEDLPGKLRRLSGEGADFHAKTGRLSVIQLDGM